MCGIGNQWQTIRYPWAHMVVSKFNMTMKPLNLYSPTDCPLTEDKTCVIKDLYTPTGDPEHIYYELEEDNYYTFNKNACNCDGTYNCQTYKI